MKHFAFPLVLAALFLCLAAAGAANAEMNAVHEAERWLTVVDGGKSGEAWEQASAHFKSTVSQKDWEDAVRKSRTPFGKALSRTLMSDVATKSLPGVPDGDYVVIRFAAQFEKKEQAMETVTVQKEKDGSWRVSGYFIQ